MTEHEMAVIRDLVLTQQATLQEVARRTEAGQIVTNFPKNPPPPGIAYSPNFARFQKDGPMALQVRD